MNIPYYMRTILPGKKIILPATLMLLAATPVTMRGQDTAPEEETGTTRIIQIEPLFEYITAPDEIESLQDKSNYLMDHFWDPMDFKSKKAVDQTALNDAFRVYSTPMQWAARDVALKSVDNLIKKLQKNPVLLYQFTRAAEEALYGPRTRLWIDEVYIRFLEAMIRNKKIDSARKARYESQLTRLRNTLVGTKAPQFKFVKPDGSEGHYFPMSTFTIIEFGDPDCHECNMARLRMETNATLDRLVAKGLVNVLFIVPTDGDEWKSEVTDYPSRWTTGASADIDDIYDIRTTPSFYTIGTDGKIISKNISVERAILETLDNVKE